MKVNTLDKKIGTLYKKTYSAPLIAVQLKVPTHRIYRSLKRQNISRRTAFEQNKIRFENSPFSYRFKEKLNSQENKLLVAALMLYAGEGAKTQKTVDFANSDPRLLSLFLRFLRQICRVDGKRLRFYLYCFKGQNHVKLVQFWAKLLRIEKSAFTKPYVRKDRPELKRLMPYGVLHIRYSDKRLLQKILFLIQEMTAELS